MNEEQRKALNDAYHAAFDADAKKQEFDYWIQLGTRNLASSNRSSRPLRDCAKALPRTTAIDEAVPAWKKHFDEETNPSHHRANLRKMPASLGRHYTYWTAQELYDRLPGFLRQLAKANQGPITYGLYVEHGKWNGRPHVNLALGNVKGLTKRTIHNIWEGMRGGRTVIRRFDPARDTGYLHKYIGKDQVDINGNEHELLWMANYWKGPKRKEAA
jgi:hypothetical protein